MLKTILVDFITTYRARYNERMSSAIAVALQLFFIALTLLALFHGYYQPAKLYIAMVILLEGIIRALT